jgi:hypothetical protein
MNSKQVVIQRETYSLLEWLGDIGGLVEFLQVAAGFLPAFLGALRMKSLLTNALFHLPEYNSLSSLSTKVTPHSDKKG